MEHTDNAIIISRGEIKEQLSRLYQNANYWTLEAYTAKNEGDEEGVKVCLSNRDRAYNRISGVREFLDLIAGIYVSTYYMDDKEYHMYGYPRIAHLEIYWGDRRGTDIMEVPNGEVHY